MFKIPKKQKKWTSMLMLFVFLIVFASPAHAKRNRVEDNKTPDDGIGIVGGNVLVADSQEKTVEDLSNFLDIFFEAQMEELHIPGAAVLIVQDDAVLIKKGYGYADLEMKDLVDPDTTIFQLASVSKLFTATAIMQLVEDGRLDMDVNINQYLHSLQLENTFGEPVTAAHLLTHTAGFDERNIGYAAPNAASMRPLGDYLSDRMPPHIVAPNTFISYSNHGFGLAGLLIEEVSGEPFARYMENHILNPLAMQKSTFDLPLPSALAPDMAQGYRWTGETYEPVPLLYRNVPPAGALSATPTDMAAFMLAHLNNGRYGNSQLLNETTILEMHQQQFTHHPHLPGMAYGFIEQYVNGYRILQHGGEVPGYRSLLFLIPEKNTGFFIVYNTAALNLMKEFVAQFMDQFYPPVTHIEPLPSGPVDDLSPYTGRYLLNRYGHRSLEKLFALFNGTFSITSDSEGYLVTPDGQRWAKVDELLFRQIDGYDYLAFQADKHGEVTHLFRSIDLGGTVPGAYEKLAWFETPSFINEFYLSWVLFVFFTAVLWPVFAGVGFLWRLWRKRTHPKATRGMYAALWIAILFSVGAIWFAGGFIQKGIMMVQQGGGELLFGMPPVMDLLLWIPTVQVVLQIALLAFTIQAWRKHYWSVLGRLHYTAITLAALAWVFFTVQYNLIGHLY